MTGKEMLTGEVGAFASMMVALKELKVVDRRSNTIVPKYILWHRIGQVAGHDYQLIIEHCHQDYIFLPEQEVMKRKYKVSGSATDGMAEK